MKNFQDLLNQMTINELRSTIRHLERQGKYDRLVQYVEMYVVKTGKLPE